VWRSGAFAWRSHRRASRSGASVKRIARSGKLPEPLRRAADARRLEIACARLAAGRARVEIVRCSAGAGCRGLENACFGVGNERCRVAARSLNLDTGGDNGTLRLKPVRCRADGWLWSVVSGSARPPRAQWAPGESARPIAGPTQGHVAAFDKKELRPLRPLYSLQRGPGLIRPGRAGGIINPPARLCHKAPSSRHAFLRTNEQIDRTQPLISSISASSLGCDRPGSSNRASFVFGVASR
jgi:hypothetical protein